jgi:uncharacterized protein with von Willebrand factor type A (vWA) domain
MKVAHNICYGGFCLSNKAVSILNEMKHLKGKKKLNPHSYAYPDNNKGLYRHDPDLIKVIEQLGKAASGPSSHIRITEIQGVRYIVEEYDGMEAVLEPKDINWITAL